MSATSDDEPPIMAWRRRSEIKEFAQAMKKIFA